MYVVCLLTWGVRTAFQSPLELEMCGSGESRNSHLMNNRQTASLTITQMIHQGNEPVKSQTNKELSDVGHNVILMFSMSTNGNTNCRLAHFLCICGWLNGPRDL